MQQALRLRRIITLEVLHFSVSFNHGAGFNSSAGNRSPYHTKRKDIPVLPWRRNAPDLLGVGASGGRQQPGGRSGLSEAPGQVRRAAAARRLAPARGG